MQESWGSRKEYGVDGGRAAIAPPCWVFSAVPVKSNQLEKFDFPLV